MDGPAQGGIDIEHALDLSREGVTLFRRVSGSPWAEISHAPLQLGTLAQNLNRLCEIVQRGGDGPAMVQVWLPRDQVTALTFPAGSVLPSDGRMRRLFGEEVEGASDPLVFDMEAGVGPDGQVVAAVRSSVLTETRDFIGQYGFRITVFTTREPLDGFAQAPFFRLDRSAVRERPVRKRKAIPPIPPVALWAGGAAAAAVAVVAVGLALWPTGGDALRPQTEVGQVVLAPDRAPVLDRAPGGGLDSLPRISRAQALARQAVAEADRPAIPGRELPAPVMVQTPPIVTPQGIRVAALEATSDTRDTIPWGFVPGLDVVGMDRDLSIFTTGIVTRLSAQAKAPLPQASPDLVVAALDGIDRPRRLRELAPVEGAATLPDRPAIPGREIPAPVMVQTPPIETPGDTRVAALETAADYRDTIPWGFVPGLDVVGMDRDLSIFTAGIATRLDALKVVTAPQASPDLVVASLDTVERPHGSRALALGFAASEQPVLDLDADRAARSGRIDLLAGEVLGRPRTDSVALDGAGPEAARAPEVRLAALTPPEADLTEPWGSVEAARQAPTRRITPSGVIVHSYAPPEVPPERPYFEPPPPDPLEERAEKVRDGLVPLSGPAGSAPERAPVAVVATAPDIVPPLRPATALAPVPGLVGPAGRSLEAETRPAVAVVAALPEIVPPTRPETETPATAEIADTPGLTGPAGRALSADEAPEVVVVAALPDIVPPARPVTERPEADTPDTAAAPVEAAPVANPDIAALILRSQEDALAPSPLALTRSSSPARRPVEMEARAVIREAELAALVPSELALDRAGRPARRPARLARRTAPGPAPAETTAGVAAVQPREVARPAPQLPTSASVARAATISDALPMRRMALIGVFGKSGSRHALVRLGNGRYVKVEPGDRIDGYEVSGIERNAIRIRRRGRDSLLVIPQ